MPAMYAKKIGPFLALFFITFLLYILFLYMQNGNTLIVTMDTASHTKTSPQLYYATHNTHFSEKNSCTPYKIKNNQYYFNLPSVHDIENIRFDPDKYKNTITIEQVQIQTINWFKKKLYNLDIHLFHAAYQIQNIKINQKLTFDTTGNDPQLGASFHPKLVSKTHYIYLNNFLSAFLIACIIIFLFNLYQKEDISNFLNAKLILYALFLFLTIFKLSYYKEHVHFGYPPDELAHLSYIQYENTHHEWIPHFKEMTMINNKSSGNYLSHPSLYYKLMNLVYDKSDTIVHNVNNFRTLSILIFLTAFLILLYIGFNTQISIVSHFVYLTVISSVPMYAYLGASITNDNLAVLGGLIFILAFKRAIENNYNNMTYFILGLGIFIAYFSKLTVAILIFFALLLFLLILLFTKKPLKISKPQFLFLFLLLLPILYYQYYILSNFHAMVPTFNVTHPVEYLKSGFYVAEQYRIALTPLQWLERMEHFIIEGWFNIHSHHSLIKQNIWEATGLIALHVIAIIALFLPCNKKIRSYCILGKIAMISLFLLMIVQYIFSYKAHLHSGYMGGLQPRYLLPFMFSFAIMASLFTERFKTFFIVNILVILLCIHAIYSDFFYFLSYYA